MIAAVLPEWGHVVATLPDGERFVFRPTLGRTAALAGGDASFAVRAYAAMHSPPPPAQYAATIDGAMPPPQAAQAAPHPLDELAERVLRAYCDTDPEPLFHSPGMPDCGLMRPAEKMHLARHLLEHAIIGARSGEMPRGSVGEDGPEFSDKFDPGEHIAAAMAHLGLTFDAASEMTMTGLQYLILAKSPKKQVPDISEDEYSEIMGLGEYFEK